MYNDRKNCYYLIYHHIYICIIHLILYTFRNLLGRPIFHYVVYCLLTVIWSYGFLKALLKLTFMWFSYPCLSSYQPKLIFETINYIKLVVTRSNGVSKRSNQLPLKTWFFSSKLVYEGLPWNYTVNKSSDISFTKSYSFHASVFLI